MEEKKHGFILCNNVHEYDCKWCATIFFLREKDLDWIKKEHGDCLCLSSEEEPCFLKQDYKIYRCPNCGRYLIHYNNCCDVCGFFEGYLNLTPHPIVLYKDEQVSASWPKSEYPARLKEMSKMEDGIRSIFYCGVINLPEPKEGVMYIVSLPLLMAMPSRKDLVAADTGSGAIRDESGRVIGTSGWVQIEKFLCIPL